MGCSARQHSTIREDFMRRRSLNQQPWSRGIAIAGLCVGALAGALTLEPTANASSHREAPGITEDPTADNTDLYAFRSPDAPNTVTLIANYNPLELPYGGPNFHRFSNNALYEIHVDNNGDCMEDISFQFQFRTTVGNGDTFLYNTGPIDSINSPNLNVKQSYTFRMVKNGVTTTLASGLLTAPTNVGPLSYTNYPAVAAQAVHSLPNGMKVFAGPRDDGFYVDLGGVFDLLNIRVLPGNNGGGVDGVACKNTHAIAIQVPIAMLTDNGQLKTNTAAADSILGVYATAKRREVRVLKTSGQPANGGAWVQVSRLGLPLVNEVLIPLSRKDLYNQTHPKDDVANFGDVLLDPEPAKLVDLLFGLNVPPAPRLDILSVLTPNGVAACDMLRLNVAVPPTNTPAKLGALAADAAGFPNGRRIDDDVTDILLRVIAGGVLVPGFDIPLNNLLGDGVYENDVPFLSSFPYLGTPHSGFDLCADYEQEPIVAPPVTHDVNVANFQFTPATLTIKKGDTVKWTSTSGFHNVVSGTSPTSNGTFTSGAPPMTTFSFTFNTAGTFPYFCGVHPNMTGTITVTN
jgi:plastocyanin